MTPTAIADFNKTAAQVRRDVWRCSVQPAGATTSVSVAKSPTRVTRVRNEMDTGWVQRALATFLFEATGSYVPNVGKEWTITASPDTPSEVGTVWRCFEFTPASAGGEHRCVCFRLD